MMDIWNSFFKIKINKKPLRKLNKRSIAVENLILMVFLWKKD
jgi:hypothetical protein